MSIDWYKKAQKTYIRDLKMKDLYNLYLIASISPQDMLYEFKQDINSLFYIVDKIQTIKAYYIKSGQKAINHELGYVGAEISAPSELSSAAYIFTHKKFDMSYGGESWAKIAKQLHNIYQLPNLQEIAATSNLRDENSLKRIVNLIMQQIVEMDTLNSLSHNTGLVLPNMIYYGLESGKEVGKFLDYKRDYDIKTLLQFYNFDDKLVDLLKSHGLLEEKLGLNAEWLIRYARVLIKKQEANVPGAKSELNSIEDAIIKNSNIYELAEYMGEIVKNTGKNTEKIERAFLEKIKGTDDTYGVINLLIGFASWDFAFRPNKIQEAFIFNINKLLSHKPHSSTCINALVYISKFLEATSKMPIECDLFNEVIKDILAFLENKKTSNQINISSRPGFNDVYKALEKRCAVRDDVEKLYLDICLQDENGYLLGEFFQEKMHKYDVSKIKEAATIIFNSNSFSNIVSNFNVLVYAGYNVNTILYKLISLYQFNSENMGRICLLIEKYGVNLNSIFPNIVGILTTGDTTYWLGRFMSGVYNIDRNLMDIEKVLEILAHKFDTQDFIEMVSWINFSDMHSKIISKIGELVNNGVLDSKVKDIIN